MFKICCISDSHMHHKKIKIPEGCDLIIHAGDFTYHGEMDETLKFLNWYQDVGISNKILIMGNHEKGIGKMIPHLKTLCEDRGIVLLHNSHVTIAGYKIFGSPYSVEYGNWAFGLPEDDLQRIWDMIDDDTDIVVTHGNAYEVLDLCPGGNIGSVTLKEHLKTLKNLKLHISGHCHESRGTHLAKGILSVNASICGIPYPDVIINPITVELP